MCIVIDANVFHIVFKPHAPESAPFEPVRHWILQGRGVAVFGGSKYKEELKRAGEPILRFVLELKRSRRAVEIKGDVVDAHEKRVIELTQGTDCDDQHIIAIFRASQCRLFCSNDKRSYKHIKNRDLYLPKQVIPRIYRSERNRKLLSNDNLVELRNRAK